MVSASVAPINLHLAIDRLPIPPPPRQAEPHEREVPCRSNLNIWKLITVGVGVLHALYQLSSYWFVGFAAVTRFYRVQRLSLADHVLVRPAEFSGSPEIVPLQTRQLVRSLASHCVPACPALSSCLWSLSPYQRQSRQRRCCTVHQLQANDGAHA